MTRLVWDRTEDRQFETGIERGVIYPYGGSGIAWNGLISVTESPTRELQEYYQDGIKLFQRLLTASYVAKIQAYTYPSVIDDMMGDVSKAPGVNLHGQMEGSFDLSYRTRIGDQDQGTDAGYTLHFVTGLAINPSDIGFQSISDQPAPTTFEWTVSGVPDDWNTRANHVSVDSRLVDPAKLARFENFLYGTDTDDSTSMATSDAIYWLTQP